MKKILIFLFLTYLLTLNMNLFAGSTYVKPYIRKDGTFVNGYYRTAPNSNRSDNYSTQGNYNPYTGKRGTVNVNPYNTRQQKSYYDYDDYYKSDSDNYYDSDD